MSTVGIAKGPWSEEKMGTQTRQTTAMYPLLNGLYQSGYESWEQSEPSAPPMADQAFDQTMPQSPPSYQQAVPYFQPTLPSVRYRTGSAGAQGNEPPPGYYESQLLQDGYGPIKYAPAIFQSMQRLQTLKMQLLARESSLNEFQRRSELLNGEIAGDFKELCDFEIELKNLESCVKLAQEHLKAIGKPEEKAKKTKLHLQQGKCCHSKPLRYRDLCDNKPEIDIEGLCYNPQVFAETCDQQNVHTEWIWGKQKIHVAGIWTSPKVHLKGLLINPVIHVEGLWCKPEIHLEGICLNPEIRIEGIGVRPNIKINGICSNLKVRAEGISSSANVNMIGVCQQVQGDFEGLWLDVNMNVTGACKKLERSKGPCVCEPIVNFDGKELILKL